MALNPKAVALAAQINKEHGEGSIITASEMLPTPRYTSGSLTLDLSLGGGWAGNQWNEVYGNESSGKTAIVLKTIAANQVVNPDFTVLWIAAEHYDEDQAEALGVDNSQVVVVPTQDMILAFEKMLEFADERACDMIVLDSYPALIAPEEDDKDMEGVVVAAGARLVGKFFRKAGSATRRSHTEPDLPILGIIINQQRDKIGGFSPLGTPQTTPGGRAKNFAFYQRVYVARDEYIKEKIPGKNLEVKVGQTIKVTATKNKAGAPQVVASVDFYFRDCPNEGPHLHRRAGDDRGEDVDPFLRGEYDLVKELVILGILYDLIERRGSRYYYGDVSWQGKASMFAGLREDLDLQQRLREEIQVIALHTEPAA